MPTIFDGHNDCLTRLYPPAAPPCGSFLERLEEGHLDLPRAREGGLGGGLFAIFIEELRHEGEEQAFLQSRSDRFPLMDPPLDPTRALEGTLEVAGRLFAIERESEGAVRLVREAGELEWCLKHEVFAAVMHLEGAEALDPDLRRLRFLHGAGLRSLGLVWSRPNVFGTGVPFGFPGSPDTGPGLTLAGRRLVRECNRLGLMLDLAHLNERGFWDVARISEAPLVVSHAAAHALCPSCRNLTDRQLDAIRDSDGVVGLNFCVSDLRPDGRRDPETPLEILGRHAAYLAERMGPRHVALGSDFDGALIPREIGDVRGLPRVVQALEQAGFAGEDLTAVCHGNWVRVLSDSWRPRGGS